MQFNCSGWPNAIAAWARTAAGAGVAALTPIVTAPAAAVTFNFTPVDGTPQFVIDGFVQAGNAWSSYLADSVTVNIDIAFGTGEFDLGLSTTPILGFNYAQIIDFLQANATSENDLAALSFLPPASEGISVLLNYTAENPNGPGSPLPYLDDNSSFNNGFVTTTRAQVKALLAEIVTPGDPVLVEALDGTITMNARAPWDFDPSDGIDIDKYDFVGVATHEIGHTLGFLSGVDRIDRWNPEQQGQFISENDAFVMVSDLFRYSEGSVALSRSLGEPVIDMRAGLEDFTLPGDSSSFSGVSYFSLDGGPTPLAEFAGGVARGEGYQAGHWREIDRGTLGIMDPAFFEGERLTVRETDLLFFDRIGWERRLTAPPVSVPEPSSPLGLLPLVGLAIPQIYRRCRGR